MPRNMSFALTTDQIRNRTKTVTRRRGWANLKPGEEFWAVVKAMGLKPGEKIERIALLRCVRNAPTILDSIGKSGTYRNDAAKEGFPGMTAAEFVAMFRPVKSAETSV
jgi:hypothetical protein